MASDKVNLKGLSPAKVKALTDAVTKKAYSMLYEEGLDLSGDIQKKFYSGKSDNSLGVRTGQARRGWQVSKTDAGATVNIFNNVPHADQSEEKTIKATDGGFLAIPVGGSLTKAGVPRFKSPRDSGLPPLFAVSCKNGDGLVLLGLKKGAKKKLDAYYVLKQEVTIPARTAGVTPFVSAQSNKILTRLSDVTEKEIIKRLNT